MRIASLVLLFGLAASACTNQMSVVLVDAATPDDATISADDLRLAQAFTSTSRSTTSAPPLDPITLGFAGDVQMIGSMVSDEPMAGVTDLLSQPDLMFVNLETVIGEAEEVGRPPIDKEFIFRSPPETLDQLVAAGVDVVALANNHGWDYGPLGARVTRDYVDASPLVGVGGGADPATAYAPAFVEAGGHTVGVVSLSRVPCDWSGDASAVRPEIAWACDRFAIAAVGAITQAAAGSDYAVVMLHAGTELADCPDDALRRAIDVYIEAGADVVAISHPHVLQGVELIDGTPVLWSTGNFVFRNNGGRTGRSAVFEVTLGAGEPIIEIHPTVLPGGRAAPAEAEEAITVAAEINDRSPNGRFDLEGVLVADPEPSLCD